MISKECGRQMEVVDAWSDPDVCKHNPRGVQCFKQSVFWALFGRCVDKCKLRPGDINAATAPQMIETITGWTEHYISSQISEQGASISNLANLVMLSQNGTKRALKLKTWTNELSLGYVAVGASVDRNADINVAISNGHAYPIMSKNALACARFVRPEFGKPVDCKDECWQKCSQYAKFMRDIPATTQPLRCRNTEVIIESVPIRITSLHDVHNDLGALNRINIENTNRINKLLTARYLHTQ